MLSPSASFSEAFKSRHYNQDFPDGVRELAHRGPKLFPVSLSAKLVGDPDRLIAGATDDVPLLEDLSAAALPLWGYRRAISKPGLCVWRLDGLVGRSSYASLAPDLDESFTTLQARRGDAVYAFFRQPFGMKRTAAARELPPSASILGDCAGLDVPPTGGTVWVNPGAEVEALPYILRELIASAPRTALRGVRCRPQSPHPPGSLPVHRVFPAAR
jgi:hypothetical protein